MLFPAKLILISIFLIILKDSLFSIALKDVYMTPPGRLIVGDNIDLICNYDLEGENLASVKWYKGVREFYRFYVKWLDTSNNSQHYALPAFTNSSFFLRSLQQSDSGHYTCEVTVAPSLASAMGFAELIVSAGLLSEVHLTVPRYVQSGDTVGLTCDYDVGRETLSSVKWYKGNQEFYRFIPQEIPPTQKFHVRGINVDLEYSYNNTVLLTSLEQDSSGQYTCEVATDAPRFHVERATARLKVIDVPKTGPEIHLDDHAYSVGDFLDTNCSLNSPQSVVNLTWLLNGREFWMNKQTGNVYYDLLTEAHPRSRDTDSFITGRILETFDGLFVTLNLKMIIQPKHFQSEKLTLRCRAKVYDIYEQITEKIISLDQSNEVLVRPTQIHWA